MEAIESEFENAIAQRILPGVLLAASTRDGNIMSSFQFQQYFHPTLLVNARADSYNAGSVNYFKSFGNISPKVGSHPLSSSATVVLASATKIVRHF